MASLTDRVPALSHPEFRRLWIGGAISNSGSMMYLAALGWVTAETTDSAAAIAAVPFIGLIPLFLISPVAGVWADKVSRRKLLIGSMSAQMAIGTAVAVMVSADAVTYPRLVAASVIGGVSGSIGAPVLQAVIPTLVPQSALRSAVVLNSMQFNISRAVGPTAAGLLIDGVGTGFVFWLNVASYTAAISAAWRLDERPPAFAGAGDRSVFGDIAAGARYAIRMRPIRLGLAAGGVNAIAVFPLSYVAPILATQALDLDASEYGMLVGAFGLGAILAGIFMLLAQTRSMELSVTLGFLGCTVGLAVIGFAPGLAMALAGMFITGFSFVNVTSNVLTSLQANLDDRVRGRVMSLWMMIYGALGPAGIIIYGAAAESVDIQHVLIAASAVLLAWLAVMTTRRAFATLETAPEDG